MDWEVVGEKTVIEVLPSLPKIQRVRFRASPEKVELKRVRRVGYACKISQSACEIPIEINSRFHSSIYLCTLHSEPDSSKCQNLYQSFCCYIYLI